MFTTLHLIKQYNPCSKRLNRLVNKLPNNISDTTPIPLLDILKHNGFHDFFWAWRATFKSYKFIKCKIIYKAIQSVNYHKNSIISKMLYDQIINSLYQDTAKNMNENALKVMQYCAALSYKDYYPNDLFYVHKHSTIVRYKVQKKQIDVIKECLK